MQTWEIVIWTFAAYLLGGIPFGNLIAKARGEDLRKHGSGNTGATNALRVLGPVLGIMTMAVDAAKGGVLVMLIRHYYQNDLILAMLIGTVAVLGHCFSPFLQLKGGKGGSTTLGVALAMHPVIALVCLAIWVATIVISRYVSLGTMTATWCLAIAVNIWTPDPVQIKVLFCGLCLLAIIRHRENISRILDGTERRIFKKGGEAENT